MTTNNSDEKHGQRNVDRCRRPITERERPYLLEFGADVRRRRGERRLVDIQLVTGVSVSMQSRLERGLRRPRVSTLRKLADAYSSPSEPPGTLVTKWAELAGPGLAPESEWKKRPRTVTPSPLALERLNSLRMGR